MSLLTLRAGKRKSTNYTEQTASNRPEFCFRTEGPGVTETEGETHGDAGTLSAGSQSRAWLSGLVGAAWQLIPEPSSLNPGFGMGVYEPPLPAC